MAEGPNIALVVFYHLGGPSIPTEKELDEEFARRQQEIRELIKMDSGFNTLDTETELKVMTVVRFFDHSGELTKLAREAEKLKARGQVLLGEFNKAKGLKRRLAHFNMKRNNGHKFAIQQKVRVFAFGYLSQALNKRNIVAIEGKGASYRAVRADEAHELGECAKVSKSALMIVYKSGDLFVLNNRSAIVATSN